MDFSICIRKDAGAVVGRQKIGFDWKKLFSSNVWTEETIDSDLYENTDRRIYVAQGGYWDEGEDRYDVVYIGGWSSTTIPDAVKLALLQLPIRAYNNMDGKRSDSAEGQSVTWERLENSDIMEWIQPYTFRKAIG